MDVIGAQLAQAYPKALEGKGVTLAPWREQITGQPRVLLLGLVGASICVLLIACTNLANLLMSRALARRTEFAVRAAIGASVDRLVRQMLTDSFVLAACGGVLGLSSPSRRRRCSCGWFQPAADRRGAADRPAHARRHAAADRRHRHGVWPLAGASRLPQDRRLRAERWRARRYESRH